MENNESHIRLNKYLVKCGICSRSSSDILIGSGRVRVNNKQAVPGQTIVTHDVVTVDDQPVHPQEMEYFMFHKPAGVVCSVDVNDERSIRKFLNLNQTVSVVSKLQMTAEGLVVLSNDGDFIHTLQSDPEFQSMKLLIKFNDKASTNQIKNFVSLLSQRVKKQITYSFQNGQDLLINDYKRGSEILYNIAASTKLAIKQVIRTSLGPIDLGDLPIGKVRPLTIDEINIVKATRSAIR